MLLIQIIFKITWIVFGVIKRFTITLDVTLLEPATEVRVRTEKILLKYVHRGY